MEFVNMIFHFVIICDPCVDRQIHTYQIIAYMYKWYFSYKWSQVLLHVYL